MYVCIYIYIYLIVYDYVCSSLFTSALLLYHGSISTRPRSVRASWARSNELRPCRPWRLIRVKTIPKISQITIWVCLKMLAKPLNPLVLLIIIPMKNGYFIGNIPNIFRQTHIYGSRNHFHMRNDDGGILIGGISWYIYGGIFMVYGGMMIVDFHMISCSSWFFQQKCGKRWKTCGNTPVVKLEQPICKTSNKLGYGQWPFQDPKLEVPTIYKAYFSRLNFGEYPHNSSGPKYGTNVPPSIGSWRSPIE